MDSREPIRDPVFAKRMQMAFELYETAQRIMRQNLRRRFPELDNAEIEKRLIAWRHQRPGAEHGDGAGRPVAKDEVEAWPASRKS
jgi:Rv0078B-related antitoxin